MISVPKLKMEFLHLLSSLVTNLPVLPFFFFFVLLCGFGKPL